MPDGSKAPDFVLTREVAIIFEGAPAWQLRAARAALCRFRPDLGPSDPADHELHLCMWWRDDDYFVRICRAMRVYEIGGRW